MEDGFPLFDPNNDSARQEQKLKEFYEEFSDNARKRLLSKNIVRPESVYDILYPKTREALLAKNVPFETNLEEDAKLIRDRLVAKLVTDETSLEKISENFRKSLLARAKIQADREQLLRDGETFRKNLISKNVPNTSDLEKDSDQIRRDNLSKNNTNPSTRDNIDKNSETFRQNNLAPNVPRESDLLNDSEDFREGDVHKNVSKESDLENDSKAFRENNLSRNTNRPQNIDDISQEKREDLLSKNPTNPTDLEEDSLTFRNDDLAKNAPKDQDLLIDSEDLRNRYRETDVAKNVSNGSDLEKDSESFRENNLSSNVSNEADLEADSETFRKNNLSSNTTRTSDLEEDSVSFREDDLSKNVESTSDLEADSIPFREDDLSKNVPSTSDLEKDSTEFRNDDLAKNKPNTTDLEADSASFREDDLSKNVESTSDLETDSVPFREDDLSKNVESTSDLESDSEIFREDDLSKNTTITSDLETDSEPFREDDLSKNVLSTSDLETDSVTFRDDDLSKNIPSTSDLETDSVPFRDEDLSANVPNTSDLETDSVLFRNDDLSFNVPSTSDLETDSVPFRNDDLSFNVSSTSDLETDSTPYLFNNLSANVPNTSDLLNDSVPFRNDDLSVNVPNTSDLLNDSVPFRNDDLSANVPNTSDLLNDSVPFRNGDLALNVPINSNIASDSVEVREGLLAANNPFESNLLLDSITYRKDALSKNTNFGLIGLNVQGAGTSAFLGISRVFTQGILVRQLLFSKNKPKDQDLERDSKDFRVARMAKNRWVPQAAQVGSSLEYGSSTQDFDLLDGTRNGTGRFGQRAGYNETGSPTKRTVEAQVNWIRTFSPALQSNYGNTSEDTLNRSLQFTDKAFSTDSVSPQGGQFDSASNSADQVYPYTEGYVTENIRLYNIERNSYNLANVQIASLDGFNNLQSFAGDEEFQALIASTVGALGVRESISRQLGSNSTPASIIAANGGKYFPGNDTDIMRPGGNDAELGSAASMMAKTAIGNPYEDEDFFAGRRGVRHIINTIKQGESPLAPNYDPQNNRAYIVGKQRDGSAKLMRQKYTVANPYAPTGAGKLIFYLKNYSSNEQFFFPPYIENIQNTENADWNTSNFLGRPEAIYTYNNSSRDASISFYVLTDYAQRVEVGTDWQSETMDPVIANISGHFTDSDVVQNGNRQLEEERLRKLKDEQNKALADINQKLEDNSKEENKVETTEVKPEIDVSTGESTTDVSDKVSAKKETERQQESDRAFDKNENQSDDAFLKDLRSTIQAQGASVQESIGSLDLKMNTVTNYSESNGTADNIYNINIIKKEFNNGEIICKPEDSINRINTMKETLMFQPSYFSGDKVDFVRKVEFLSKLTRPAAASDQPETGFSFTKPPICHIHLGDWWNHDIVVNSVSFDYADAPWTLDEGRVQPMWVLVNINFNIIGPYKSFSSRPPLSTDAGGMYSPIGGITSA